MKILAIRIKNLASLEGNTEIDFTKEPLYSAGIFAITGPTGAGKSTVLDALCLALYCKTPRYLQAKESGIEITDVQGSTISQGDVRGILRDGTGEGFAEVDFAGVDGQRYRATWRVRRARDKADGGLQQYSIALKNIDTNTDIPGRKNDIQLAIERLVGLNFEQFTRSVLLAQGDFTTFLKADKEEKSALLEKLTGTRIYSEISKQIFFNYSIEKRELEDLNLQRQGIATLTSEERENLEREKTTMEQSIAILENEALLLSKEVAWHTQLTILQTSLSAAHNAYEQSIESKQYAKDREQELNLVEQVQSTRTWVDGKQVAEKQVCDKKLELGLIQTRLGSLQQEDNLLERQLQKASEIVTATTQKEEEAAPLLVEARALDVQIREKIEQVKLAASEVKTLEDSSQELEQRLQVQQQQSEQLFTSISQLQQWKEEHKAQQPIAENYGLINSKLGDARSLLDTAQSLVPKLEITQNHISETKQVKVELEAKSAQITQQLHAKKELYTAVIETLTAIPIAGAENEKAAVDSCIEETIAADAHWKLLFQNKADLNTLRRNLEGNRNDLIHKGQSLARASEQLLVAAAERKTSRRMLDKARLAAAENVESLRSQLLPEEPCPVCGSEQHPYVNELPQLNHVLAELEAAHFQIDEAYATSLQTESSLQETIKRLKEAITIQEQETNSKERALTAHQKIWENFAIYPRTVEMPDEQKATWLTKQLQAAKAKQKELQQLIHSYGAKKMELDALKKTIDDLERQRNENNNAIKDIDRRLESLQEQESQHRKDQQLNDVALAAIEQSLSAYFNSQGWLNNWKNNPVVFVETISDFAELWKDNIQKLEDYSRQHGILAATLEVSKGQLQNTSVDLNRKQVALAAVSEQQDILTEKRTTTFNGEAAGTIEKNLKLAVTVATRALDKIKSEREIIQTSLTRTRTQKDQAEIDLISLSQHAATFAQKIQEWITTFNIHNTTALGDERLLQLLSYDGKWIEAERRALRMMDDAITQTQSVFLERSEQLLRHKQQQISERNEEELTELLNTTRAHLQVQIQRKNEFGFQLLQDLANKQKIGDLLGVVKAKELVTENWAKLNDIIGSADGKKFRLIAQEYTLDVLLGYANVHLGMLSSRYQLQRIPNTLALQVKDQDMGDEVRTVYSLSGGESFLASLALALGLASLSSSRMQVESLFIDEGFGSLDPTTLSIAMDALERLHNQGRKVGVISHVQEMTERIPVQIKVSKQQNGKSMVEVPTK